METVTLALTESDVQWLKHKHPERTTAAAAIRVLMEARERDNGEWVALKPETAETPTMDEDLAYSGGGEYGGGLWGVAPPKEWTVRRGDGDWAASEEQPVAENADKRGQVWWDDKGGVHIENMVLNGLRVEHDRVSILRYPHKGL